jgi:ABC-type polysaccharide/polyol phosphate export permease
MTVPERMPSDVPAESRAAAAARDAGRVLVLRPSTGWAPLRLRDLWDYRELLYFLTWRDIKVRYKQTALGAAWAVIQPFFTMVVFSVFFGRLAKLPSEGVPYPVFTYCALVPWTYFATALTQSSNSLVDQARLITKVYFPRLLVPERWRPLYALNPMTGVVEGFRWALLGRRDAPGAMLIVSVASVLLLLIGGLFYFRRMERRFADVA